MPTDASPSRSRYAIVVMGVSGAGKSTLAQLLAERLQCAFVEADVLHDAHSVALMSAGQALSDEDRWPWLDRVGRALRQGVEERGIVIGACSALRYRYRQRLRDAVGEPTLFVVLQLSRPELEQRMATREGHFMPGTLLASQLATLEMPMPDEDALVLDAHQPPQKLCDEVLAHISAATHMAKGGDRMIYNASES